MQQRQLRLGDILDDYCPRERRVTNHAVVAMIGDDVKQTRCTTCDADHEYKHAKVPRQRRKADSPAALYAQVLGRRSQARRARAAPAVAGRARGRRRAARRAVADRRRRRAGRERRATDGRRRSQRRTPTTASPTTRTDETTATTKRSGPSSADSRVAAAARRAAAAARGRFPNSPSVSRPATGPTASVRAMRAAAAAQQFQGNRSGGGGNGPAGSAAAAAPRSSGGRPPQGPIGSQCSRHGPGGRKRSKSAVSTSRISDRDSDCHV